MTTYRVSLGQYLATLTVVGAWWAARGNPAPLSDGTTRKQWQSAPYSLHNLMPRALAQ